MEKSSKSKQTRSSSSSRFQQNSRNGTNNPCVANIYARYRTLAAWKSMSREPLVLSIKSQNLPIIRFDLYEHYHAGPSSSHCPGDVQSLKIRGKNDYTILVFYVPNYDFLIYSLTQNVKRKYVHTAQKKYTGCQDI